jgi:hypothetical protein
MPFVTHPFPDQNAQRCRYTSHGLAGLKQGLLFRSENCVLRGLCHSKFNDRVGRSFDLLRCLRVGAGARFPLDRITLHLGEGLVRISAL